MSLLSKLRSAKPVFHTHTILTFIRETMDDYVEVSPDFGATWEKFPLSEIVDAEIIKNIPMPKGSYPLVRLILKEEHPTIEIIALRAQVKYLNANGECQCEATDGTVPNGIGTRMLRVQCGTICADESGCDWWACIYWCGFLR